MSEDEKKKTLVLTKARSRSTTSFSLGVCSGPVATCFLHPFSLSFTLLFVSPSQCFSPQLVLCSHLCPELGSIRQIFNLGGFCFNF